MSISPEWMHFTNTTYAPALLRLTPKVSQMANLPDMKTAKNGRLAILALAICSAFFATACTQNQRARHFGGTGKAELPAGRKLVNATWKEGNDLWLLTRAAKPGEPPETYEFIEDSSLGMMNGKVVIIEK